MVNALNRNLQRVKRIWGPVLILRRLRWNGPDARGRLNFTVPVSLRCPQGTGLLSLPPRVPQGAAVSGERISQGPPGNVVAFGMPAPSEEGFRAVSSDASCQFAVSGLRSDCTTRQSVAYRASPPKNGDTGSVLNRSRQSVKRIWGPLLFLKRQRKKKKDLTPEGSGQWGLR